MNLAFDLLLGRKTAEKVAALPCWQRQPFGTHSEISQIDYGGKL
jgi:hypothetical protein